MLNKDAILENAKALAQTQVEAENPNLETVETKNPSQMFRRRGQVKPPSESDYHQGLVEVSERTSGASWYTMKFVRERDAIAYAKRRQEESKRFDYDVVRRQVTDAKVKELCEIPGFLKR